MKIYISLGLLFVFSCASVSPIKKAMASDDAKINIVMKDLPSHEVQVFLSEVIRGKNGSIRFKEDRFQVDDDMYFYPASAVKLPIAILALEKLNENPLLDRDTTFKIENDSITSTFAKDILDIFAVSSNEASNRLFEFLGQDDIQRRLSSKGIKAQISHRLSVPNSGNLMTKSLIFYNNDDLVFKTEPISNHLMKPLGLKNIKKGIGYLQNGQTIHEPMDFSDKNHLPIRSLQGILKRLVFPQSFPPEQRFQLTESDRQFLIDAMSVLPKDIGYPSVDYADNYVKFLVLGDSSNVQPNQVEIHNKVGFAYGYLTDVAYIINNKTKKEYLIAATVPVNKNKIYNDGLYEYDSVGIPFLGALGRLLIFK